MSVSVPHLHHRNRRYRVLMEAFVLAALCGCSLVVDSERQQCSRHEDCAGAGAGDWRCVDNICQPAPDVGPPPLPALPEGFGCLRDLPAIEEGTIEWRIRLADFLTLEPLTEGTARLCNGHDVACQDPVVTDLHPDEQGIVSFNSKRTFTGYLEFLYPDRFPTLAWINPRQYNGEISPVPVFNKLLFPAIGQLMGQEMDPEAGHVLGVAVNCDFTPVPGVTASLTMASGKPEFFYYISSSGFPIKTTATEASGHWGGFNVSPGVGEAETHLADIEQLIGKSALIVRKGHVTVLTVAPSPP